MRCDKCRRKFKDSWIPQENWPKYEIHENTGLGEVMPVNLCDKCSQLFQEWLCDEPEEDEGFGR